MSVLLMNMSYSYQAILTYSLKNRINIQLLNLKKIKNQIK